VTKTNFLEKSCDKNQLFGKKLGQKPTFWKKVVTKTNFLEKSWDKNQLFGKKLGQKNNLGFFL